MATPAPLYPECHTRQTNAQMSEPQTPGPRHGAHVAGGVLQPQGLWSNPHHTQVSLTTQLGDVSGPAEPGASPSSRVLNRARQVDGSCSETTQAQADPWAGVGEGPEVPSRLCPAVPPQAHPPGRDELQQPVCAHLPDSTVRDSAHVGQVQLLVPAEDEAVSLAVGQRGAGDRQEEVRSPDPGLQAPPL